MAMVEGVESALNLFVLIEKLDPETKYPFPIKVYTDKK